MYDIFASDMEFEQCSADKKQIRVVVPYAVIHYILSGSGTINGQKIAKGAAIVSSMNSYMDYYPDKEDPWSYIYIRLYGEGIKKAFDEAGFGDGTHIVTFTKHAELKSLLMLHKAIDASEDRDRGKVIANALFMLHKEISNESDTVGMQERNVRMIKNYIDDNYFNKITVSDISKRFHLSEKYIRNLFVKYLGVSTKKYIQNKRMERARTLLLETDISVSTVALSAGYDDALLFSKMFSKHFSLSPQKYRQQNGL